MARNPSRRTIPGSAVQIRYRRSGSQRGMYYHDFKPGVKMIANADGSVTLRGRKKIHAVDSEPGFWQKYGHGGHGMARRRRNPSRGNPFGMSTTNLLLLAVGGYLAYTYFAQPSVPLVSPDTQAALDAYRAGERDPLSLVPEEVPVDWSIMPSWDWGTNGGLH